MVHGNELCTQNFTHYKSMLCDASVSTLRAENEKLTTNIPQMQTLCDSLLNKGQQLAQSIPTETFQQMHGLSSQQILDGIAKGSITDITPTQAIELKSIEGMFAKCQCLLNYSKECLQYVSARLENVHPANQATATHSFLEACSTMPLEQTYVQVAELGNKQQSLNKEADHFDKYHIQPLREQITALRIEISKRQDPSVKLTVRNGVRNFINFFRDVDERTPNLTRQLECRQAELTRQEQVVTQKQSEINTVVSQLNAVREAKAGWIQNYKSELSQKTPSELYDLKASAQQQLLDSTSKTNSNNSNTHQALISGLQNKITCIKEAIKQKTFSPDYQQQLTTMRDSLVAQREYGISAIQDERLNAIKVTLHEQGALHEAHYELSSQAYAVLDKYDVSIDNTSDSFKHGQLRKIKLVHKPGAI